MSTPVPYAEALERALGRVIADARAEQERQSELFVARADALMAKMEARLSEIEARENDRERLIGDAVSEGIASALERVTEEVAARCAPDPAPVLVLEDRVAAVESQRGELAELEARIVAIEASPPVDAEGIAQARVERAIAELPPPADLEPLRREIEALRESIPAPASPPDLSGFATKEELQEVRADLPEPADLEPLRREIEAVRESIPPSAPAPDLSGLATKDDLRAIRSEMPEAPKDWTGEIEALATSLDKGLETSRGEAEALRLEVAERLARHPGVLPVLRGWSDGVSYAGDIVVHEGSTWQARRDTGKAPPHDDWSCICAKGDKGERGADGKSPAVRGTHSADERYEYLDVVTLDGSSFIAKWDDPGGCPGEGWQLVASRGGRGRAVTGEKGEPGDAVVSIDVSPEGVLTLTNGDGTTVEADIYHLIKRAQT